MKRADGIGICRNDDLTYSDEWVRYYKRAALWRQVHGDMFQKHVEHEARRERSLFVASIALLVSVFATCCLVLLQ